MHLVKIVPEANMYRFYKTHIVRGLLGDWGFVRNWGRIGSPGRVRTEWFETEEEAKGACNDLVMEKAKRGYALSSPPFHCEEHPRNHAHKPRRG